MASFEEFITCQICFEIYGSPQSLSCRHTICAKCVTKLKRGSKIQCPTCQIYCDVKDIKPDYNIIALIDYYQQEENCSSNITEDPSMCKICNDDSKSVESYCRNCKQFMCSQCSMAHKGIPSIKTHTVKNVKQIVTDFEHRFKAMKLQLEDKQKLLSDKQEDIAGKSSEINDVEGQVMEFLKTSEDQYVTNVLSHYEGLREKVKHHKESQEMKLQHQAGVVKTLEEDVGEHLTTLNNLIGSKDAVNIIKTGKQILQQMSEDIDRIAFDIPKDLNDLSILKTDGLGFEPITAAQIDIIDGEVQPTVTTQRTRLLSVNKLENFIEMCDDHFATRKCIPLDTPSKKVYKIADEIWCLGTNQINIYKQGIVRSIKLETVSNATAMAVMEDAKILVTCLIKKTLQIHNANGMFESVITKGYFADMVYKRNLIYVLDYNHCKVYTFRMINNTMVPSKVFKLAYSNGSDMDTMFVHNHNIYIGSWNNNAIYIHNENGNLIGQFGETGSQALGLFKGPRVCTVDKNGNVLVTDCGNHRLQVLDVKNKEWKLVLFDDASMGWPYAALAAGNMNHLWIVDYKSLYIAKRIEQ